MSSELYRKISTLLEQKPVVNRHTFFQLKHFIIGKELTLQAKLRKCLVELDSRKDAIQNIHWSIEEAKDDLELLRIKMCKLKDSDKPVDYKAVHQRKLLRRQQSLMANIIKLEKKLRENEEEAGFFYSAFLKLEEIEKLKSFDDLEENAKLWDETYSQELQLRLLLQKAFDPQLVKQILALDKESPIRSTMINILDQLQKRAEAEQSHQERQKNIMDQQINTARNTSNAAEDKWQKESPA